MHISSTKSSQDHRRSFSIRSWLLASFGLLVVVSLGGVLSVSYLSMGRMERSSSHALLDSISREMSLQLNAMLSPIEWAVREKRAAIQRGDFSASDPVSDKTRLAPSLEMLPSVGSLMVADDSGYQLLVMRYTDSVRQSPMLESRTLDLPAPDGDHPQLFTREVRTDAWKELSKWAIWDRSGREKVFSWEMPLYSYDPRLRPWYTCAVQTLAGQGDKMPVAWTGVYSLYTTKGLGISASTAARDPSGRLIVVAYDLLLDGIAAITARARPSPNGKTFIVSKSGFLIGPPNTSPSFAPLLAGDSAACLDHWKQNSPDTESTFMLKLSSGRWWASFRPYHVGSNEVFWICVMLPETDLLPESRTLFWLVTSAALVALLLAGTLAWRISRSFAGPIARLAEQGQQIASLNFDRIVPVKSSFSEIQDLALTLSDMRASLQAHISEAEQSHQEILKREAQMRDIIESPIGGFVVLQGDVIRYANRTVAYMYGVDDPKSFYGHDWHEYVAPSFKDKLSNLISLAGKGHMTTVHPGWQMLRKDGSLGWVQSFFTPIENEGRPAVLAFLVDIGELKSANERQTMLQEQLRQSQKLEAVGMLAGGLAHDLNNLLLVVGGNASLAQDPGISMEERQGFLSEIDKAVQHSARMLKQLLAFSRRQTLKKTCVEMNALVRNHLSLSCRLFPANIKLDFKKGPENLCVFGDESQLEKVLLNLSLNARDAQPEGGSIVIETHLCVLPDEQAQRLCGQPGGSFVCLSIEDRGCGMSPEILARIFEPFFSTKRSEKGTGLGLAVVYGIVKQHNGGIEVRSSPGKGTRFEIYLPLHKGNAESLRRTQPLPPQKSIQGTILVAEDNEAARILVEKYLVSLGYKVLTVSDGKEAVVLFEHEAEKIDLLFFDVVMPGMNGFSAYELCAARKPGIPVLFASGYLAEAALGGTPQPPGTELLQKPYDLRVLADKIQSLIPRRGA
jgi:PAS domain S-box-containing protein